MRPIMEEQMLTQGCINDTVFTVRTARCHLDVQDVAHGIREKLCSNYDLFEVEAALSFWIEQGPIAMDGESKYFWVGGAAGR
jgi:hypothetical protein